ncbi:MAG: hypothetical protein AB1813_19100 [Verrucomicrobiota bacterium]
MERTSVKISIRFDDTKQSAWIVRIRQANIRHPARTQGRAIPEAAGPIPTRMKYPLRSFLRLFRVVHQRA